jgi:hypothetical protein
MVPHAQQLTESFIPDRLVIPDGVERISDLDPPIAALEEPVSAAR